MKKSGDIREIVSELKHIAFEIEAGEKTIEDFKKLLLKMDGSRFPLALAAGGRLVQIYNLLNRLGLPEETPLVECFPMVIEEEEAKKIFSLFKRFKT